MSLACFLRFSRFGMGALRLTLLKRSMRRWALPLRPKADAPYMQRRQHGRDAGHLSIFMGTSRPKHHEGRGTLHRIARRLARHAVERVEQFFAPRMDRIVLGEQFERADHARPLEAAEHDIVGI